MDVFDIFQEILEELYVKCQQNKEPERLAISLIQILLFFLISALQLEYIE